MADCLFLSCISLRKIVICLLKYHLSRFKLSRIYRTNFNLSGLEDTFNRFTHAFDFIQNKNSEW